MADDDKIAKSYGRENSNSAYREYYQQMMQKMFRGGRQGVFKPHREQPDEEITLEYVLDECVIYGTVNKVVDDILAMHAEVGDFGELVYAGMDWVDADLAKRSMELMATEVMPRVNETLQKTGSHAAA